MKYKAYKNPPVAEILMDFVFNPPLNEDTLRGSKDSFNESLSEYSCEEISRTTFTIQIHGNTTNHSKEPNVVGYKFRENNDKSVIELLNDRLIIKRYYPYKGREHFKSIIKNVVKATGLGKTLVSKIGLRSINHLTLKSVKDLNDYILTAPATKPLENFNGFVQDECLSRHLYTSPKSKEQQAIVYTVLKPNDEFQNIILDIDIIEHFHNDSEGICIDSIIENKYTNLADSKNFVFESVITDRLRETFNEQPT